MAYGLQIVENDKVKVSMNVKYENLSHYKKPEVVAKAPNGKVVKERTTYQGQVLGPGSTQRQWVDEDSQVYSKQELTFWYNDEQVPEISQSKVFEVEGFQPLTNYTDNYVIDKYYELYPDNNKMKKDHDKKVAVNANLSSMRKLWEYLNDNQVVARGEFCTSSRGFVATDGYIRAIKINGNKWGLEIGIFKEEKKFQHLNEGVPQKVTLATPTQGKKKLKFV